MQRVEKEIRRDAARAAGERVVANRLPDREEPHRAQLLAIARMIRAERFSSLGRMILRMIRAPVDSCLKSVNR